MKTLIEDFEVIKKDLHKYKRVANKRLRMLKEERQYWHDKKNHPNRPHQLEHLNGLIKDSGDHCAALWYFYDRMKKLNINELTEKDKKMIRKVIKILNKWYY